MNIDIYPSSTKRGKYLGVPQGTNLGTWQPPAGYDPDLMKVGPRRKTINVQAGQPVIGMNPDDVVAQINQQGWAGIGASVTTTVGHKR